MFVSAWLHTLEAKPLVGSQTFLLSMNNTKVKSSVQGPRPEPLWVFVEKRLYEGGSVSKKER